MKIIIQNSSDIPIYQQIYDQIKEAILTHQIKEGELLPSIRQLSRMLKVSVITTTRAYTDLENDQYIMIVQGKGCYVKSINQTILEEKLMADVEGYFTQIMKCAGLLHKTNAEMLQHFKTFMEDNEHDR